MNNILNYRTSTNYFINLIQEEFLNYTNFKHNKKLLIITSICIASFLAIAIVYKSYFSRANKPLDDDEQFSLPITSPFIPVFSDSNFSPQLRFKQQDDLDNDNIDNSELGRASETKQQIIINKHTEAACVIQKNFRAYLARKKFKYLKEDSEKLRDEKIFNLAKAHLEQLEDFCYLTDGQLNNKIEVHRIKKNFWGVRQEKEDPEKLRARAQKLQQEGKEAEAKELTERADENESDREEYLKGIQPTLFPLFVEGKNVTLNEMIEPYLEDLKSNFFFHGTTIENARIIRKKGFSTSVPSRRLLDSGSGTYFALDRKNAKGYAAQVKHANDDNEDGILKCKIKSLKIAYIKNYQAFFELINLKFIDIINLYVEQYNKKIEEDLKKLNLSTIKGRTNLSLFYKHLHNEGIQLFFKKLGYEAVFISHSDRAGCGYLNVFEPSKEKIEIIDLT